MNALDLNSTRPYLIRAIHEWCCDNGLTPYILVRVDETVQVPVEHVKKNEIVLNVSLSATDSLQLGNEYIEFKARFAGVARNIFFPVGCVLAIYARESGEGISFPELGINVSSDQNPTNSHAKIPPVSSVDQSDFSEGESPPPPRGHHPHLRRIK